MTTYRTRRLGATALAAAGLLASCPAAASATSHATDPRSPDAKDAATQAHVQVLSRSDPRSPDARDASLAAIRRAPAPTPVVVRVSHPGHSAWADAAIGAGSAAGILLLAGGATGLALRRRGAAASA